MSFKVQVSLMDFNVAEKEKTYDSTLYYKALRNYHMLSFGEVCKGNIHHYQKRLLKCSSLFQLHTCMR